MSESHSRDPKGNANMAVEWLRFSLRGHGCEKPTGTEFFEVIGVSTADRYQLFPSDGAWKSARVELLTVDMAECQSAKEPTEEFAARTDRSEANCQVAIDPHAGGV